MPCSSLADEMTDHESSGEAKTPASDGPPAGSTRAPERPASKGPARARGPLSSLRHPPLWMRWALSVMVFGALTIAAINAISSSENGAPDVPAELQANREAQTILAQDQAPHDETVRRLANPRQALERAIAADMNVRIRHNELSGPLQTSRCTPTAAKRANRRTFRCSVQAGDVAYPFLGVVDVPARHITWCKRDPSPTSEGDTPVDPRCTA